MHIFHCWHKVEGSVELLPWGNTRCRLASKNAKYIAGTKVWYRITEKCCICGKTRKITCADYNIERALEYKKEKK